MSTQPLPWSTESLPTAQQIGMRVLGCQIHRHDDGLPPVVELPDGEQVLTAAILLAHLTKPLSARDDYRILAEAAISGRRASVNAHELAAALDELDQLRQDLRAERAVRANIEAQLQDLLAHDPR